MKIGILGGACFWKTWNLPFEQLEVDTPYGKPADMLCKGKLGLHEVYTLQRHGKIYELSPEKIPYQANTFALHKLGVGFIIDVTSCGCYKENAQAGDIALFDQVIDYTRKRPDSLFKPVITKYTNVNFAQPISEVLINFAHELFKKNNVNHHFRGTLITEDGPRFSTLAESKMYKIWGADFVNHTSSPAIYFFRELNIPVLGMTMITNRIEFERGGHILSANISNSTIKYGHRMSDAIKLLIENIPDNLELEDYQIKPYDTSKFELRQDNKSSV